MFDAASPDGIWQNCSFYERLLDIWVRESERREAHVSWWCSHLPSSHYSVASAIFLMLCSGVNSLLGGFTLIQVVKASPRYPPVMIIMIKMGLPAICLTRAIAASVCKHLAQKCWQQPAEMTDNYLHSWVLLNGDRRVSVWSLILSAETDRCNLETVIKKISIFSNEPRPVISLHDPPQSGPLLPGHNRLSLGLLFEMRGC